MCLLYRGLRFAKANNADGCTSGDVAVGRVSLVGEFKWLASDNEILLASLMAARWQIHQQIDPSQKP